MRKAFLGIVLVAGAAAAFWARSEGARDASEVPLPGFDRIVEGLAARGRADPAALGYEILAAVTRDGAPRDRLLDRLRVHPPPERGPEVLEAEGVLGAALVPLAAGERALLWMLAGEPDLPVGLRCRLIRLLDGSSPDPARLVALLRPELRAGAWEAAVRLGSVGGGDEALREAVRSWRGWGRQYPIVALVLRRDRGSLELVKEAVTDASPAVRRHVLIAVGRLGGPAELGWIDQVLRAHPDPGLVAVGLDAKRAILARERPRT